ncbi:MAG: hypothetical protein M0Z94_17950 [Dehalococcoidales bacterium]|nr:hypothetical protein [Dehalococcoidales bacterium]
MERIGKLGRRLTLVMAVALLWGLVGCSASAGPAAAGQTGDLAALQQQVAGQGTRIAALETRVATPQPAGVPTTVATPRAQPTATMVPAVSGLPVDGATKGSASAKVTITEYLDYL